MIKPADWRPDNDQQPKSIHCSIHGRLVFRAKSLRTARGLLDKFSQALGRPLQPEVLEPYAEQEVFSI